jgi:GTP-sensing pleiotropic transcriptional regulator CodY
MLIKKCFAAHRELTALLDRRAKQRELDFHELACTFLKVCHAEVCILGSRELADGTPVYKSLEEARDAATAVG